MAFIFPGVYTVEKMMRPRALVTTVVLIIILLLTYILILSKDENPIKKTFSKLENDFYDKTTTKEQIKTRQDNFMKTMREEMESRKGLIKTFCAKGQKLEMYVRTN